MPRNASGLYTLPAGNPVATNTLIETTWANPTMEDIADALTGSLPRDGSAPMTGPLTLPAGNPTVATQAANKAYVDAMAAGAASVPVGTVLFHAAFAVPPTYLLCDGAAVSRTTYATLFSVIGTTFGAGDNSTTFNVPYLGGYFVRGRDNDHPVGTVEASNMKSHSHGVTDGWHQHGSTQAAHNHSIFVDAHGHTITDPGHVHSTPGAFGSYAAGSGNQVLAVAGTHNTSSAQTGVTVNNAGVLGGSTTSATPVITGYVAQSNISVDPTPVGGVVDDTWPKNLSLNPIIKATA